MRRGSWRTWQWSAFCAISSIGFAANPPAMRVFPFPAWRFNVSVPRLTRAAAPQSGSDARQIISNPTETSGNRRKWWGGASSLWSETLDHAPVLSRHSVDATIYPAVSSGALVVARKTWLNLPNTPAVSPNFSGNLLNLPDDPRNSSGKPLNVPEGPRNVPEKPPNPTEVSPNSPEKPPNLLEGSLNGPEKPPNLPEGSPDGPEKILSLPEVSRNGPGKPLKASGEPLFR